MSKRKILLSEVVANIEKNGWPQSFGDFFEKDNEGNITAACALGQSLLNLNDGKEGATLRIFTESNEGRETKDFFEQVMYWNDIKTKTLPEILALIDDTYSKHFLDTHYAIFYSDVKEMGGFSNSIARPTAI